MQHTLEWEYVPEYELLGLSSSFGSHRLGWSLNRAFGWSLACESDVVVTHPKGAPETQHPTMRYVNREEGVAVTLVLNRIPGGILAQGQGASRLDYLVMLNHHELAAHEVVAMLRKLPEVSFVTTLDPTASGALEPLSVFE